MSRPSTQTSLACHAQNMLTTPKCYKPFGQIGRSERHISMIPSKPEHSAQGIRQNWAVVAAFFDSTEARWLDDFIVADDITFTKVPVKQVQKDWHFEKKRITGYRRWVNYYQQARDAFALNPDGIITCFPQLAMCAGLIKRMRRANTPIIAYNYNLGAFQTGMRQKLARFAARGIDRFVVHSPVEIESYADYLGQPPAHFKFIPLQRGEATITRVEQTEDPYLLSMGSAHRDYPTLVAAVEALKIKTIIVTRPDDARTLPQSPFVTYMSNLTPQECKELLAKARMSVTPISNLITASGQITFVDALRLGVPTIATKCPGTEGYIDHMRTGVLVAPFDVEDMTTQIDRMWSDTQWRDQLSAAAKAEARQRFTDEAVAVQLNQLIEEVK